MAEHSKDALFFAVFYTIIPSDTLGDAEQLQLRKLLDENGAVFLPLLPDGRVDDPLQNSHVISTHVDFPDYNALLDAHSHVVKPPWVYQSIQKGKQAQTRQYSPDSSMIFSDVVLTCADLPSGDKDAIIAGVLALGGLYSSPMTKLVTHVVSMTSQHDKVRLVREKNLSCKVILPHWFDDCLKLGKKISESPYTLPDPEILSGKINTAILPRLTPDLEGATSAVAGRVPRLTPPPSTFSSPSTPRKNLNVFMSKKVFFSRDLNINDRLARTLQELVEHGGGMLTQSVAECNIYIGHYRDGMDYISASRAGKEVANLSWFYNVITRNKWTNPLSKLLHYPVSRDGIPGVKGMKISVSNYTGEARLYLENLVKEAGGEFTRTMKQDNTHLITAHKHSEKCEAAQEWNINIVNHLWLEETYAKCAVQSLTNPRFTHFPRSTNLGEVVGQVPIDIECVRPLFFQRGPTTIKDVELYGAEVTNGKTPHPSAGAVKPLKARPSPRKAVPASSAVPAALPAGVTKIGKPSGKTDKENLPAMSDVAEEDDATTPEPRTVAKRSRRDSDAANRTPSVMNGHENDSPSTTGSRSSKQRALNLLHKAKDDITLFQKEMKRKGGVTHGGRRTSDAEPGGARKANGRAPKRTSEEAGMDDKETDGSEGEQLAVKKVSRPGKKAKPTMTVAAEQPPLLYKMMVSGDERWLGNLKKEAEDKKLLRSLGIQLTQQPTECTLLCAPKILRTRKFIAALASAPQVVSTGYLDRALKHESLDEAEAHPMCDDETEQRLGFRLSESIRRASENDGKLLRGWTIYVSPHVAGGFETYQEIIGVNGGTAIPYRGRTGVQLPHRRLGQDEDPEAGLESQNQGGDEELDFVYLISGTVDEEIRMWTTFRKLAEKQDLEARIVKTDWLLTLAMCQKVEWDEQWELQEDMVPGWNASKKTKA